MRLLVLVLLCLPGYVKAGLYWPQNLIFIVHFYIPMIPKLLITTIPIAIHCGQ